MDMGSMQITKKSRLNIGAAIEQEQDPSARLFNILVADDSLIDRNLLEASLSREQYSVLYARSGRQAMHLFEEHQPSLVITDWVMPDLTGIQLCQRIRHEFQESYTYIIILTAMTEVEKLVIGLGAGADDYLTKPFHSDELLARVGVGRRVTELHRQIEAKNRQLQDLAMTDPMTGLSNRRAVEVWAARELSAAVRHEFPFWVVMADLDDFKAVNDTFGHAAGDTVLRRFGEILKASTRSGDICARIGGEEFLIVLTHAGREGVQYAIERVRENLAAQRFRFRRDEARVTASFGIDGHSRHQSQNFNRLVSQADAALYCAKRLGRNRVEYATSELNSIVGWSATSKWK
jgi:diguanylate cyclase (GGDEF)-like protein